MADLINSLKIFTSSGGSEQWSMNKTSNAHRNSVPLISIGQTDNCNDSGFTQWRDAMRMVARLPGGLPPEFRIRLWDNLADQYLQQRGLEWSRVVAKCKAFENSRDEEIADQIQKDLHRTGCTGFSGAKQAVLKRVLVAYAKWNPSVGYCQGFNMIGAMLLQMTAEDELLTLKIFVFLIEGILPQGYFSQGLRGLAIDMAVFREILKLRKPTLHAHLSMLQRGDDNPPLTDVFTMHWFLTLFIHCLPSPCVLRIWDLVLLEGSEVLLRAALVLWAAIETRILCVTSADDFYSVMGVVTREMLEFGLMDPNSLVKCIVSVGPFPFPGLDELRRKHKLLIAQDTPYKSFFLAKRELDNLKRHYASIRQRQRSSSIIHNLENFSNKATASSRNLVNPVKKPSVVVASPKPKPRRTNSGNKNLLKNNSRSNSFTKANNNINNRGVNRNNSNSQIVPPEQQQGGGNRNKQVTVPWNMIKKKPKGSSSSGSTSKLKRTPSSAAASNLNSSGSSSSSTELCDSSSSEDDETAAGEGGDSTGWTDNNTGSNNAHAPATVVVLPPPGGEERQEEGKKEDAGTAQIQSGDVVVVDGAQDDRCNNEEGQRKEGQGKGEQSPPAPAASASTTTTIAIPATISTAPATAQVVFQIPEINLINTQCSSMEGTVVVGDAERESSKPEAGPVDLDLDVGIIDTNSSSSSKMIDYNDSQHFLEEMSRLGKSDSFYENLSHRICQLQFQNLRILSTCNTIPDPVIMPPIVLSPLPSPMSPLPKTPALLTGGGSGGGGVGCSSPSSYGNKLSLSAHVNARLILSPSLNHLSLSTSPRGSVSGPPSHPSSPHQVRSPSRTDLSDVSSRASSRRTSKSSISSNDDRSLESPVIPCAVTITNNNNNNNSSIAPAPVVVVGLEGGGASSPPNLDLLRQRKEESSKRKSQLSPLVLSPVAASFQVLPKDPSCSSNSPSSSDRLASASINPRTRQQQQQQQISPNPIPGTTATDLTMSKDEFNFDKCSEEHEDIFDLEVDQLPPVLADDDEDEEDNPQAPTEDISAVIRENIAILQRLKLKPAFDDEDEDGDFDDGWSTSSYSELSDGEPHNNAPSSPAPPTTAARRNTSRDRSGGGSSGHVSEVSSSSTGGGGGEGAAGILPKKSINNTSGPNSNSSPRRPIRCNSTTSGSGSGMSTDPGSRSFSLSRTNSTGSNSSRNTTATTTSSRKTAASANGSNNKSKPKKIIFNPFPTSRKARVRTAKFGLYT